MSLMGVDIGSSGCKVAVYSVDGMLISTESTTYSITMPGPGEFELDSRQVLDAVYTVMRTVVKRAGSDNRYLHDPLKAVSFGSFSEAMVPVSSHGEILGPSIFSHDQRGKYAVERFNKIGQKAFYKINPNILGYSYSYPKLVWYRESAPDFNTKVWKYLNWSDFLTFQLTGEAATTYGHANRTLLFDLWKEKWSDELLEIGGVERRVLADLIPSGITMGYMKKEISASLGFPEDVLVVSGGHDQCMNALGAGAISGGSSVTGIGTFECTTLVFDDIPDPDLMLGLKLGIEHHTVPGKYVAFIYNQGGSVQTWFMQAFTQDLIKEGASEREILNSLTDEAPNKPGNVVFLPFLEPSGAPVFLPEGRGCFFGIGTGTGRGALYRALLEGESMFFLEAFEELSKNGLSITSVRATGGGSRSDLWLQIKADILQRPVHRVQHRESGTVGAAIVAGLATGMYGSLEEAVGIFSGTDASFFPRKEFTDIYARLYKKYKNGLGLVSSREWRD